MHEQTAVPAGSIAHRLEAALAFAQEAGALTLRYFGGSDFETEYKHDDTHVTTADRGAEQLLRERIGVSFPDDGVLGEEFGESESRSGWRWVLDPIDGTFSFVHGVPLYGTLVACEFEGETLAGVIHMPALGETVYASSGEGAWHIPVSGAKPDRARVSGAESLAGATLCTTSHDYFRRAGLEEAMAVLHGQGMHTRGWSDCYAHLLCATGRIDAVVEPVLHPWDIAPMQVIYPEAGGAVSDWRGRHGSQHQTGVAGTERVHRELVGLLSGFVEP